MKTLKGLTGVLVNVVVVFVVVGVVVLFEAALKALGAR